MSCAFPRHTLALHVEGDLPPVIAGAASQHLERCAECREFFAELQASQALVKSLRRETVRPAECAGMRRDVMAALDGQGRLGWVLRAERVAATVLRRHAYAAAACAIVGIVSVSVLAQIHHAPVPDAMAPAAVFEGRDTLLRPAGYRAWILLSEPAEPHPAGRNGTRTPPAGAHRVYIDPEGYRAYAATGRFAEGTVMIRESVRGEEATHPHPRPSALLVSVKDSARFEGGWGFFDFAEEEGRVRTKTRPSPESEGCRTCHLEEAETDSVFTQFHSASRAGRHGRQRDAMSRRRARLADAFASPRPSRRVPPAFAHS